jgi:hypothetical protein
MVVRLPFKVRQWLDTVEDHTVAQLWLALLAALRPTAFLYVEQAILPVADTQHPEVGM